MTHRELCKLAAKHLKAKGLSHFTRCQYVVCDFERAGECPDAFGWGSGFTQLIEVKVSRNDFISDKSKPWRKYPDIGLGEFRSYLCPEGVITESDLPAYWGLLWVDDNGVIAQKVKPSWQKSNSKQEINLITSVLRREGVKPKIYSYKKYKND